MPQANPITTESSILTVLLNSELFRWLIQALIQAWRSSRFRGPYKVLEHTLTLELIDAEGNTAIVTKHQEVSFLQNGVFAIQDQAYGDGELFADYQCSPGIMVDRHKEGSRWKVLISLRSTRNRGEQDLFRIQRTIANGFTQPSEYFQTRIDHPTEAFTFSVIFPCTRHPRRVTLIEENIKRTHVLDEEQSMTLSGGRVQYSWHSPKPRLYEGYILQWEW